MRRGRRVDKPLISVVMPVYNSNGFLKGAIESIKKQTYRNFEFIIVNDGSTDKSAQILHSYRKKDKRIKIFKNKRRLGFDKALSLALSKAKGRFIARMDADDISAPDRLKKQLAHLLENPDIVAVGGQSKIIDEMGRIIGNKNLPTNLGGLYLYILDILHVHKPDFMISRNKLPKDFIMIERQSQLMKYGKIDNPKDIIFYHRVHGKNIRITSGKSFLSTVAAGVRKLFMYNYVPYKRRVPLKFRFSGKTI